MLKIFAMVGVTIGGLNLTCSALISSMPRALLFLSFLMADSISLAEKGFSIGVGGLLRISLAPTWLKNCLKKVVTCSTCLCSFAVTPFLQSMRSVCFGFICCRTFIALKNLYESSLHFIISPTC